MNLLMKEGIFPIDTPRILFVPDSLGSTTFFIFSSENALFSSNILFFFSYSALVSFVLNLLISSPIKSVAPSGGFSTSFFFFAFLFLSSFDYLASTYSFTSDNLIWLSISEDDGACEIDWLLIDGMLIEDFYCCKIELFSDEVLCFDLSLIEASDESWTPFVDFLLKFVLTVYSGAFEVPMKLLIRGWLLVF